MDAVRASGLPRMRGTRQRRPPNCHASPVHVEPLPAIERAVDQHKAAFLPITSSQ